MLGLGTSLARYDFTSVDGGVPLDGLGTMIAWYKFNELQTIGDDDGDGTDEVSSWSSSTGSANPVTQSTAIKQPAYNSGHLDFHQPQQQKLQAATNFGFALRSFTIMFSMSPDNYTGSRTIMGNSAVSGNLLRFNTSNTDVKIQFNASTITMTSSETFPTDRFILTITRDTSANPNPLKMYKNETEVFSGTHTFGTQTAGAEFNQFGCQAGASNPFDGQISEVAIWANVLTDADRAIAIADMKLRTGVA